MHCCFMCMKNWRIMTDLSKAERMQKVTCFPTLRNRFMSWMEKFTASSEWARLEKRWQRSRRHLAAKSFTIPLQEKHDHPKYQRVTWDEFLEQADIVSIHAPLTPVTEKLVDAKALRKMKNTAVLLNLGRGPIVDQKALAEALQNAEIAAAGLDVLEKGADGRRRSAAEHTGFVKTYHHAAYCVGDV